MGVVPILHGARHDVESARRRLASAEELVVGQQEDELHRLVATHVLQRRGLVALEAGPSAKEAVREEVRREETVSKLPLKRVRKHLQSRHILQHQHVISVLDSLMNLAQDLHPHPYVDLMLQEELLQSPHFRGPFLVDLLQIDERGGEHRYESSSEEQTEKVAANGEDALSGSHGVDIVRAQCQLCQPPLVARDVLVWRTHVFKDV
mmetsp:Transcript_37918/g.88634  ORF Transcript_37918/g.88634 Transcript_37918/m.88634 type:complete len:206 (-) Transcript_37918:517-1134(-)